MLYVLYKDYFKKQFFSTGKSLSESFYCLRNLLYAIAIHLFCKNKIEEKTCYNCDATD